MSKINIGFVHPGEMGISLAASALNSNHDVFWCSAGRSQMTLKRAEQHSIKAISSLQEFCNICDIIIAVCPPHAATQQAQSIIDCDFQGVYVDANAVSPQTVIAIANKMQQTHIDFVDGGIIGLPAWKPNTTWLYLAGTQASKVAGCFINGPLETSVLGTEIGKASALKMCFAANSKGMTAMLTAILAAAEQYGVRDALEQQWEISNAKQSQHAKDRIMSVAHKAWRFQGEMKEIASTLAAVGMPAGFHLAAADIYSRQTGFKDTTNAPSINAILQSCLKENEE